MENNLTNLGAVKPPAPNVAQNSAQSTPAAAENPKREIKKPYVGVLAPPNISKTPVADALVRKKEENPKTKYKLTEKKYNFLNFQNISSAAITVLGICAAFSFKKDVGSFIKNFKIRK